jgi:hypothetical protein
MAQDEEVFFVPSKMVLILSRAPLARESKDAPFFRNREKLSASRD